VRLNDQWDGDLWDADLATGIFSRLTTDPAHDTDPAWAPDEHALAFMSTRTGRPSVFLKDLVSGKEDALASLNDEWLTVDQWTPDGRYVILRTYGKAVYAMRPGDDRTPRMLVDTPYTEDEVHVSPDGRWVVFETNESGRWEVYVAGFPAFTSKRQISSGGGTQPQWRADGRELFYVAPDGSMMSVHVDTRAEFTTSAPTRLFTSTITPSPGVPRYGVSRDGQRFLALEPVGGVTSFTFVLNWSNAQSSNDKKLQ
jgi:Tol biopolymer transport system component